MKNAVDKMEQKLREDAARLRVVPGASVWNTLEERLQQQKAAQRPPFPLLRVLLLAASVVLLLGMAVLLPRWMEKPNQQFAAHGYFEELEPVNSVFSSPQLAAYYSSASLEEGQSKRAFGVQDFPAPELEQQADTSTSVRARQWRLLRQFMNW